MHSWTYPLDFTVFRDKENVPHWLAPEGWFPNDSVISTTTKGSMESSVLPFFIEHLDRLVRNFVPKEQCYLRCLDGHKSRRRMERIQLSGEKNIAVVILPANTTDFLQPCDNTSNKLFNQIVRYTRDELLSVSVIGTGSIGVKLKLAVAGYNNISSAHIRAAFENTGIWSMDYRFVDRLKKETDERKQKLSDQMERIDRGGPVT